MFSTFVLDELAAAGALPALIVTTPDKPAGRGLAASESAVKKWALAHNIPLLQPEKFDDAALAALRAAQLDCIVVAAYGKILPAAVLALPRHGGLNVHPSLLPRYRGTSPVESQILADEKDIGVSVIVMDEQMDHGPVLAQEHLRNLSAATGRTALNEALWHVGGKLLAEAMPKYIAGEVSATPQDHTQATFTKKMSKEDGELNLAAEGMTNYLKYLAYEGWPGTYFFVDGKRIKITHASFKNGKFVIERVIPEGKKEHDWRPEGGEGQKVK